MEPKARKRASPKKSATKKRPEEEGRVEVFVFPLPEMVFFPSTTIPLNIFEPRYIQMVRDAVETNTPIALSLLRPEAQLKRKQQASAARSSANMIAGVGKAIIVEERYDGTMIILVEGTGKVQLGEIETDRNYARSKALLIEENLKVAEQNQFKLNRLKKTLFRWIDQHVEDDDHKSALLSNIKTDQLAVECLSMFLFEDSETRQSILEINDINERVELLARVVQSDGTLDFTQWE